MSDDFLSTGVGYSQGGDPNPPPPPPVPAQAAPVPPQYNYQGPTYAPQTPVAGQPTLPAGISAARWSQVKDLVNQFELQAGYAFTVPIDVVNTMALDPHGINSLFDVSQYLQSQQIAGKLTAATPYGNNMPWIWYGMTSEQYATALEGFDTTFKNLTGQVAPDTLVAQALKERQGTMTAAQFQTFLLSQDSVKATYGWLRYGLDFQQFQQQKLQMLSSFGRSLSDTEAVQQLQYLHQAQGATVSVAPNLTFTQQEKKSAFTGTTGAGTAVR